MAVNCREPRPWAFSSAIFLGVPTREETSGYETWWCCQQGIADIGNSPRYLGVPPISGNLSIFSIHSSVWKQCPSPHDVIGAHCSALCLPDSLHPIHSISKLDVLKKHHKENYPKLSPIDSPNGSGVWQQILGQMVNKQTATRHG